jgi:pyridoxal phosphate enzyme (YggS family)
MQQDLVQRLEAVRERIESSLQRAGRPPEDCELVAVSKRHPAETVRQAAQAGQLLFGESRVQEATAKIPLCPGRLRWHFIGHLQKNKIRKALPHFELFHGVDSLDLAEEINRIATEEGERPRILLEVNTSGEASKFGFQPDQLRAQLEDLLELPRLEVQGLMTMAPVVPKPELAQPFFARLRELRDSLQDNFGVLLPTLSMGMSGDFEAAILEGSTLVRVGTAVFGERPQAGAEG